MSNIVAIKLTAQQESFVNEICSARKPDDAARVAGYTGNLVQRGWQLLRTPTIAAAIRLEITQRLMTEALPLAYSVLCELARDDKTPGAVRRAAARDLIDRAGFVAPKAPDASAGADKPLSEMSSEELRALVDKLESELGARAIPVSDAQTAARVAPKRLLFLD